MRERRVRRSQARSTITVKPWEVRVFGSGNLKGTLRKRHIFPSRVRCHGILTLKTCQTPVEKKKKERKMLLEKKEKVKKKSS